MNKQLRGIKKLNEEELGHYLPAFFFLKIGTKEPLNDLNNLSTEALSTFVHEYIHFLQDIFTTWGLRHITHIVDLLKTANDSILGVNESTFKVPINIPSQNTYGKNIDLVSIFVGDSEINYEIDQILGVEENPNGLVDGYEYVTCVEVKVKTNSGEKKEFRFGATCILESMAYLIQSELFDNVCPPQFPYKSVELLCDFIYPEVSENRHNLIALCEVALNSFDPGHIFVDILKRMKAESFIPTCPSDIYTFADGYWFGSESQQENMALLFEKTSKNAEKSLTDYFTSNTFKPAKDWVSSTMENAREWRLKRHFTFMSLVEGEKTSLHVFVKLVREIGTPLMSNDDDLHWAIHPNTESIDFAGLFKAISEVYMVLFYAKTDCDLKEHCKQLPSGDITCEYCDLSPWKMVEKTPLCSFAQIWKMWGLESKSPILGK